MDMVEQQLRVVTGLSNCHVSFNIHYVIYVRCVQAWTWWSCSSA